MRLKSYSENEQAKEFTMTIELTDKEWGNFDPRTFDVISLQDKIKRNTNPKLIQNVIYDHFELADSMIAKMHNAEEVGRIARFVRIRRFCYYFMKEFTNMTSTKMGDLYGQDHATVLFHIKKVKNWMEVDSSFVDECEEIRQKIVERLSLTVVN